VRIVSTGVHWTDASAFQLYKEMTRVECPRCKGKKWLPVYDIGNPDVIDSEICTHCQGEGWVMAEVPEEKVDKPERLVPRFDEVIE